MKVRCRMAPSPTGKLHIGTAHTTLFNYLFAKHSQGTFVMRIDDSDPIRSKKEFEADIIDSLKWLGISWDEGPDIGGPYAPYRQSERKNHYQKYIDRLLAEGKAYKCFCTKDELDKKRKEAEEAGKVYLYDKKCRNLSDQPQNLPFVVRLANPNKIVTFNDMVRGQISVDTTSLGDFIISRSDGSALLNFAVVVDDIEFEITHAIRGEDFLNATPYQILIYEALGISPPEIANLSFIYAPDHTKLSKRHGATGVSEYRELGYLPEALLNFMAFLGWNPGDDREIFSLEELIKEFDFNKILKGAPTFNKTKLDWYNQQYIKKLSNEELAEKIRPFTTRQNFENLVPLVRDRLVTLKDFDSLTGYFFEKPAVEKQNPEILKHALAVLEKNFDGAILETEARKWCSENNVKVGDYFMALRLAITGLSKTPPLWDIMKILGAEETLSRLQI